MASTAALGGRADTMMDSDAGGFTADDRAETLRMLELAGPVRSDSESDDDDIGESEFYPPPATRAPEPPQARPHPQRPSAPPPRPQIAAPSAIPAPAPVRPALRAPALPPPTPITGRSESPANDEDDQDAPAMPPPVAAAPRVRAAPQSAPARTDDTFSIPATPHEALLRYDASMNYLVEMLSQLTGDNTNAVTAKLSLEIFRRQMLSWHGTVDQNDWEKATKSMLMFSETVRMVIHSTVQRVKEQRTADRTQRTPRAAVPPRPEHANHAKVTRAIPTAIPTDSEASAPPVKQTASMGMHYNPYKPPEPARPEPPRAEPDAVPEYVSHADDALPPKKSADGCTVM